MKRWPIAAVVLALVLTTAMSAAAVAQPDQAMLRVVHASPDAPAVDVLVDGNMAFSNLAFRGITRYAALPAGSHNIQVVPAGATEPAVIEADVDLTAGTDYTIVAVGRLADIEPLVLTDDNSAPPAGQAKVRFVHASPNAPAVDIAEASGRVIFSGISFKGVGDYTNLPAGTYDVEARLARTDTVALAIPNVTVNAGTVYTVFAVGLVDGEPPLSPLVSVDAIPGGAMGVAATPGPAATPGAEVESATDEPVPATVYWLVAIAAAIVVGGWALRRRFS
ncbi:MAG: DUF4397 domain-containing protein [Chloroflexota bacterium]